MKKRIFSFLIFFVLGSVAVFGQNTKSLSDFSVVQKASNQVVIALHLDEKSVTSIEKTVAQYELNQKEGFRVKGSNGDLQLTLSRNLKKAQLKELLGYMGLSLDDSAFKQLLLTLEN